MKGRKANVWFAGLALVGALLLPVTAFAHEPQYREGRRSDRYERRHDRVHDRFERRHDRFHDRFGDRNNWRHRRFHRQLRREHRDVHDRRFDNDRRRFYRR
jgi:hypothetical protein